MVAFHVIVMILVLLEGAVRRRFPALIVRIEGHHTLIAVLAVGIHGVLPKGLLQTALAGD